MNDWPYHQYWFLDLAPAFHQLPTSRRQTSLATINQWRRSLSQVQLESYTTLGFKPGTTLMLWARSHEPAALQTALRDLLRTAAGTYLSLTHSLFGISRASQYSRGSSKSSQVIGAAERLPYLIIYPFTKTTAWYQLDFETRRRLMGEHIKTGAGHPDIRQCLLYAYGVDDHEFIVSYETSRLEDFQDLIVELRSTTVREYTQNDLPIYTCLHKSFEDLIEWL